MFSHVNLQVVRLVECLPTNLAVVFRPHVSFPDGSLAILHMFPKSVILLAQEETIPAQRTDRFALFVMNRSYVRSQTAGAFENLPALLAEHILVPAENILMKIF